MTKIFGTVVCGFPGVGKSSLFNSKTVLSDYHRFERVDTVPLSTAETRFKYLFDSDSSRYPKDNFPKNYLADVMMVRNLYPWSVQLISTHKAVLDELSERRIPHTVVYPNTVLRETYIQRYIDRGSPNAFVNHMISNWGQYVRDVTRHCDSCPLARGVEFIRPGTTLASYYGDDEL